MGTRSCLTLKTYSETQHGINYFAKDNNKANVTFFERKTQKLASKGGIRAEKHVKNRCLEAHKNKPQNLFCKKQHDPQQAFTQKQTNFFKNSPQRYSEEEAREK